MEHTTTYNLIMNRFNNGRPFTKAEAHKWIDGYAKLLDPNVLTQDEASELHACADQKGVDILPTDAMGRLDKVENDTDDLTLMVAELIGGGM